MKNIITFILISILSVLSHAQLLDKSLVDENGSVDAPGGLINKSLEDQIGSGQGDIDTEGSSIYLIKRDPARSIRRGRQLFQRKFSLAEGLGPRVNPAGSGDIVQTRALGAGFTESCSACHSGPRGSAGFGGAVTTRPDSRDAPHLFGLGLIEQLSDEMTTELRAIRDEAFAEAYRIAEDQNNMANNTVNNTPTVVFSESFENNSNIFQFVEDTFGTNNAEYSFGKISLKENSPQAIIVLGGLDDVDIFGMSAAWETSFSLDVTTTLQMRIAFSLDQAADYESDEISQAMIAINGEETVLETFIGDGNGGSPKSSGIQTRSLTFTLPAGEHVLSLGAFNSKKHGLMKSQP